ncbi:hypothetical protein L6452_05976 [Arctium lappa]|uniref:Uncharacterized protein n=1 Tax=Arctium lappa TaxID=4217 RepID=A0ACB9EHY6_ARCLA|nr:hypothetical protein L6452_05976 [Arctium lappa]
MEFALKKKSDKQPLISNVILQFSYSQCEHASFNALFNPSLLQYTSLVCSHVEIPSIEPPSIYKGINIHRAFSSGSCLHRQATFPATSEPPSIYKGLRYAVSVARRYIQDGVFDSSLRFGRFQEYVGQTLLILENINQDLSSLNFLTSQFLRSHLEGKYQVQASGITSL